MSCYALCVMTPLLRFGNRIHLGNPSYVMSQLIGFALNSRMQAVAQVWRLMFKQPKNCFKALKFGKRNRRSKITLSLPFKKGQWSDYVKNCTTLMKHWSRYGTWGNNSMWHVHQEKLMSSIIVIACEGLCRGTKNLLLK